MKSKFAKAAIGMMASMIAFSAPLQAYDCCYCECDQWWFDADYLYWQIQDSSLDNFSVVSSTTLAGLTAAPTTVLGSNRIKNDWRSGGRFALGYWFDDTKALGVEGSYFFLPSETRKQSVLSTGVLGSSLYLGIPYTDAVTGLPAVDVIATPGLFGGSAGYKFKNWMQNAELNVLTSYSCGYEFDVAFLGGFRYWNYDENFEFVTTSPTLDSATSIFATTDKFDVENNFYGGQVGIVLDYDWNCFTFNVKGKVALGGNVGSVNIHGETLTNAFTGDTGTPTLYTGGVFAQGTNIGHHSKTTFCVIPEVNVNVGYWVTDSFRLQVGYNFLYASNVYLAGKQIDDVINPSQAIGLGATPPAALIGTIGPVAQHKTSSIWTQGVNAGFEFKF